MKKTNNKGFRLIEIIGIVVILAVIMIVTVPLLENTLRNSEQKRIDSFKKNLILVCENYMVDKKLFGDSQIEIYLEDLLEEKYIEEIPEVLSDDPFAETPDGEKNYYSYVLAEKQNDEYKYELCLATHNCEFIN